MNKTLETLRGYHERILDCCNELTRDPYLVLASCSTILERIELDETLLKDYSDMLKETISPLRSIAQHLWERMID